MLARSSLFKSSTPHLSKLSSINQTQSRFASGGFTPADMPIIKTKWAATTKVYHYHIPYTYPCTMSKQCEIALLPQNKRLVKCVIQ